MSTIVFKLGQEDKEEWKTLHDSYKVGFLHGECYAFAIALNQGLGWPIVVLVAGSSWWHAGVRSPDGKIFDARGFVSEEEFGKPFPCKPPYDIREVSADDLNAIKRPFDHTVQRASELAEVLWPELPWRKTRVSKIVAFVDELEALCRKHKLWIRSPYPNPQNAPPLAVGEGDEGGYELRPIGSFTYTINRYLVPR